MKYLHANDCKKIIEYEDNPTICCHAGKDVPNRVNDDSKPWHGMKYTEYTEYGMGYGKSRANPMQIICQIEDIQQI